MTKQFAVQIENARTVTFAELACDLLIGTEQDGTFTGLVRIKDVFLKLSGQGKPFVSMPSRLRMRNGEPVLDKGKKVYDDLVDLAFIKDADNSVVWEFRDYLITRMQEAKAALGSSTPAAAPRRAAKPTAPAAVNEAEPDDFFGGDTDDDDLPF